MTEQLALLDVSAVTPEPEPRTYWENRGPNRWEPVVVRTRYAIPGPPPDIPFLDLQLGRPRLETLSSNASTGVETCGPSGSSAHGSHK